MIDGQAAIAALERLANKAGRYAEKNGLPLGPITTDGRTVLYVLRRFIADQPAKEDTDFTATVRISREAKTVSVEHKFDADWHTVLRAHEALRDWAIARITGENECPYKPSLEARHPNNDLARDVIASDMPPIDKLLAYPFTEDDQVLHRSELCTITVGDLRALRSVPVSPFQQGDRAELAELAQDERLTDQQRIMCRRLATTVIPL